MNTAQEAFHIILAFQAGKKLECRELHLKHWSPVISYRLDFLDFTRYEFRIAVPKTIGQNKPNEVHNLIAAFRAGKYIECNHVNSPQDENNFGWAHAAHLSFEPFNFEKYKYRVVEIVENCICAPQKPREFWINEYPDYPPQLHLTSESAKKFILPNGKTIHVVEKT